MTVPKGAAVAELESVALVVQVDVAENKLLNLMLGINRSYGKW